MVQTSVFSLGEGGIQGLVHALDEDEIQVHTLSKLLPAETQPCPEASAFGKW